MATYKHLRSSTANKRPTTTIVDGQLAINTNTASPGLFFKDSAGTGIVKVGPVHVGTTAPNSVPASGGSSGNYTGEQWLDTSVSPAQMKVWNGSTWVGIVADELPVSKLQDGAARQLIQTDAAGTGVEWTSNVDVPGTLDVTSTATFDSIAQHPLGTAGAPTITFTGDTNTGIYSPGADQVAISTNGTGRLFVASDGKIGVAGTPFNPLDVFGSATLGIRYKSSGSYAGIVADNASSTGGGFFGCYQNGTQKAIFGVTGAFLGDTSADAGVFAETGEAIRFFTNGSTSEKARIDSSGKLLVGTSTAFDTTSESKLQVANFGGVYLGMGNSDNTVFTDDNIGLLRFYSYGGGVWEESARISAIADANQGSGDKPSRLVFSTTADGASSPTERMRIGQNGSTSLFSSDNGHLARVSAGAGTGTAIYVGYHSATSTTTGTVSFQVFSNGNVQNTNNSYGAISDAKLKENIVYANSQWDDIKALQVRNYNFKEGQTHTQIGLVAQEVELVSPGLVTESLDRDEEGNDLGTVTKSVNYSVLYMKAVKALQEAMERIEQLETEMAEVKAQLQAS
jgi:hypothetical protein